MEVPEQYCLCLNSRLLEYHCYVNYLQPDRDHVIVFSDMRSASLCCQQEIADLNEQLRDVMFYLEAQQKLSTTTTVSQEEIQASTVVVGASVPPSDSTGKKRSKKHR